MVGTLLNNVDAKRQCKLTSKFLLTNSQTDHRKSKVLYKVGGIEYSVK